jgi:excisionase family DNA binding protein
VRFFGFLLGTSGSREEINSWATEFLNYVSAVYEGRCKQTVRIVPMRGKAMSMIEQLRARLAPLNVKEVADLLGVAESTVQRWVRNRDLPAIRVADTIRFDPTVLADRLEGTEGWNVRDSGSRTPLPQMH